MIRCIKPGDLTAVVEMWNRTLKRDPISGVRFANWLFADPDFDTTTGEGAWVAEESGEIVGFIRAIKRVMPNDYQGLEPEDGWLPVIFVAPEHQRRGIGASLFEKALGFLRDRETRSILLCGQTGSAPGYLFPGIDKDAYASGLAFYLKHGFEVKNEPVSMSGFLVDFDDSKYTIRQKLLGDQDGIKLRPLTPDLIMSFFSFLREDFPGDWNQAARNKIKSGGLDQIIVATKPDINGEENVIGYCQWESDGHFGPFGVSAKLRDKGLGGVIFAEACRVMKANDIRTVWFNWADEDVARFYRRFGLETIRQFAILQKNL